MSSPSYAQSPGDRAGPAQPSTAGIPVAQPPGAPGAGQLPPHPGATAFVVDPPTAVQAPQATGPVGFVPGPPAPGAPPLPAPAVAPAPAAAGPTWPESLEADDEVPERRGGRAVRLRQDRRTIAAIGLAALSVLLLELGLALDFGAGSLWDEVPLWSAFATAAALVGLLAIAFSAVPGGRSRADQAWRAGAAGLVCLSVFWLLVALPAADGDRGFLLTAALGSLGAALWIGAARD